MTFVVRASARSLVVALLTASSLVHAESLPEAPSPPPEPVVVIPAEVPGEGFSPVYSPTPVLTEPKETKVWYGWQTLIADAGASLLGVVAFSLPDLEFVKEAAVGAAALTYAFSAPMIHVAHKHWNKFGWSLGLRMGLVGIGLRIGELADKCADETKCVDFGRGAIYGALVGALVAMTLDATVLAYDKVPTSSLTNKPAKIAWWPTGGLRKDGGFTLRLAATF